MKKMFLCSILFFLLMSGMTNATLTTIGTATYSGTDYNLIWNDDNNGNSVVWLDYTHTFTTWDNQVNWAANLDSYLSINLYDGYTVTWDDNEWRLPTTPSDESLYDGRYITESEVGHLLSVEMGLTSNSNTYADLNATNFDNLITNSYWLGTEYTDSDTGITYAWHVVLSDCRQQYSTKDTSYAFGLAIRSGQVSISSASPVPEPGTILLLGAGLLGLSAVGRKKGIEDKINRKNLIITDFGDAINSTFWCSPIFQDS